MKRFLLNLTLIALTLASCDNNQLFEEEGPMRFNEGYFIVNRGNFRPRKPASIDFRSFSQESFMYSENNYYSQINNEDLEGLLMDMVVDENNGYLLVVDKIDNSDCIIVVDRYTLKKKKEIIINMPDANRFFIKDNKAYVINSGINSHNISIVDVEENLDIEVIELDFRVNKVIMGQNKIYLLDFDFSDVYEFDINCKCMTNTFSFNSLPTSMLKIDNYLYVATRENGSEPGGIYKIDTSTGIITLPLNLTFYIPKHLVYDNGLFCIIIHNAPISYGKLYTWDGVSSELIGPYIQDIYNPQFSYTDRLRFYMLNNRVYITGEYEEGGFCNVYDLNRNEYIQKTSTGYNTRGIVFNK